MRWVSATFVMIVSTFSGSAPAASTICGMSRAIWFATFSCVLRESSTIGEARIVHGLSLTPDNGRCMSAVTPRISGRATFSTKRTGADSSVSSPSAISKSSPRHAWWHSSSLAYTPLVVLCACAIVYRWRM